MNGFYNEKGIGDTLLITLKHVDRENRDYDKKGDVVRLFRKDSGEITGYNIFRFSMYGMINDNGAVEVNERLVATVNEAFSKNGIDDTLQVDNTPDFVVGSVLKKEKHPNADKLNICQVDVGEKTLQIVCGAPNVDEGQKVVVSLVGAVMPSGTVIKEANLRGVDSYGMICSAKELDLPHAPTEKGILVLPEEIEIGEDFFEAQKKRK
jgi:tRNA-binding protein